MKLKNILSLVACGAALAVVPAIHAQDASPAPSSSSAGSGSGAGGGGAGGGQRGGGMRGGMSVDTIMQMLTTRLTLTQDEQTQIKPIVQTYVTTAQTIRADTTLQQTDRRSKMQDARTTMTTAINAILTPDQQAKYATMQQNMRGGRRGGGGGGGGAGGGGGGGGTGGGGGSAPATTGS